MLGPCVHLLEGSPALSGRVIEVSWKTPMRRLALRRQRNDGGPCQNSRSDMTLLVTMVRREFSSNRAADCLPLTRLWCSGSSYWRASARQCWAPLRSYYVVGCSAGKCFRFFSWSAIYIWLSHVLPCCYPNVNSAGSYRNHSPSFQNGNAGDLRMTNLSCLQSASCLNPNIT